MTPSRLSQRSLAGKGRYQQMVQQALESYPGDYERAARSLARRMRRLGFRHNHITAAYMEKKAHDLGLT